ncbi:hypothetical protein BDY21DRAFT_358102 [Lineolata rhizophorae]|uniref:Rad4 transglutaminase-like domain-containing protein n=1 Tax=Lineolata rhizophorae TaxID=578093 RepID=A0A6A6NME8_9PEZI|nr:hypothetical protein BDY21DRAFT_358102 [Lineolata rhizophorae]
MARPRRRNRPHPDSAGFNVQSTPHSSRRTPVSRDEGNDNQQHSRRRFETRVFVEMLEEDAEEAACKAESPKSPPSKRRRTARRRAPQSDKDEVEPSKDSLASLFEDKHEKGEEQEASEVRIQTVFDDETTDDEDWEDVDLDNQALDVLKVPEESADKNDGDLSIVLDSQHDGPKTTKRPQRKGITAAEKKIRLDVHKTHLKCLLAHNHIRNAWCNDASVKMTLREFLASNLIKFLRPNRSKLSLFERKQSLLRGLETACEFWKHSFQIDAIGLQKPSWIPQDKLEEFKLRDSVETIRNLADFRAAARVRRGSQDLGAQLFCALLRSIDVETRLVCSLQPLTFAGITESGQQSPVPQTPRIYVDASEEGRGTHIGSAADLNNPTRRLSRISRPSFSGASRSTQSRTLPGSNTRATIKPMEHPLYWVEVWEPAYNSWIPVDPFKPDRVDKRRRFEPPMRDPKNLMSYVIAFETDSVVFDVTRRYAQQYNAKTQKLRVDSTAEGKKWWSAALRDFRRPTPIDRDRLDEAVLNEIQAREPMPKNIQDFKGHPVFVLERHLRQNEVIHPKRSSGRVNIGSSFASNVEPVYRRRDVHVVRSAEKWYRMGRDIKPGEQPLKRAAPRKRSRRSAADDVEDSGDSGEESASVGTSLYAAFQTTLHVAPPVINGRVPRNAYDNIDIYVPSMVPPGGTHLRSPDATRAARIVGVDAAPAVTGFEWKGRQGTAVVTGAVVASEFAEAVQAVVEGLEWEREMEKRVKKSRVLLRLWRRFYQGLRIKKRVDQYEIGGEIGGTYSADDEEEEETEGATVGTGGFFPDPDAGPVADPTASREARDTGGGFFAESEDDDEAVAPVRRDTGKARATEVPSEQRTVRLKLFESYDQDEGEFAAGNRGSNVTTQEQYSTHDNRTYSRRHDAISSPSENAAGGFIPEYPYHASAGASDQHQTHDEPKLRKPSRTSSEEADIQRAIQESLKFVTQARIAESSIVKAEQPEEPKHKAELLPEAESDSDIEMGSMKSHDPEDEDMEPLWLQNDSDLDF